MSVLSLGSFHSCCTLPLNGGKSGELVVAEDSVTEGSPIHQRPGFLPPPLPLFTEGTARGLARPLTRLKSSQPLKRPLGDTVVFEDGCFSDSVSRLSSFGSDHAALYVHNEECVEGDGVYTELPFSHLPPVDAAELAEFDIALASEVLESIQVLCEEYERFYQARRRLRWLEEYLQRHKQAASHFSASVEEDLCITRLRQKLEWLDSALERTRTDNIATDCDNGNGKWLHEQLSPEKKLWLKQNKDCEDELVNVLATRFRPGVRGVLAIYTPLVGILTLKVQGVLHNPTYHIISLIREVDLHPNWVPFLSGSRIDHIIEGCGRRCQMVVTHEYSVPVPFIPARSVSMYAFACDALDEPGVESIIIYGRGIPEDSKDFWGYPVPKSKGARAELKTLCFIMEPIDGGKSTGFTMLAESDPKIHIPEKILAWLCKQYAKYIFHSIEKLSENFDDTEYPARIEQDREFYDFIETAVIGRMKSMHERGRSGLNEHCFASS